MADVPFAAVREAWLNHRMDTEIPDACNHHEGHEEHEVCEGAGASNPDSSFVELRALRGENVSAPVSAFDRAWQTCRTGGVRDFAADVIDHHRIGFVYSLPGVFLMAKAVQLDDNRTAWFIHHAAGDVRTLFAVLPFPLDWIAFRRPLRSGDTRLRVYSSDRIRRLVNRHRPSL